MTPCASPTLRYWAYGLTIDSELALWPAQLSVEEPWPGVEIRTLGSAPLPPDAAVCLELGSGQSQLVWPGVGVFRASAGERLDVVPVPSVDLADLRLVTAGLGLAMLLQQRGCTVLHGSCVSCSGVAVCLAGPSGVGKSTIASALCAEGHELISDGMTVVAFDSDGRATALPGPRLLKLWPDAARRLGWDPDRLEPVALDQVKLLCPLEATNGVGQSVLDTIFILDRAAPVGSLPLPASAGVLAVLRNLYLVEHVDKASLASMLSQAARVASVARIRTLDRGPALSDLPHALREVARYSQPPAR